MGKAGERAARRLVGGVTVALVLAVVWLSGAAIPPRPRRYARRVHAAGRWLLLAAVAGLLWSPVPTLLVAGGVVAVVASAAMGNRLRLRALGKPRRVRVRIGAGR